MKKKELIERLVSEIELGKVKTLGIYGHGASGKSTFAQELYQELDSQKVNLLETDPYITSGRHLVVPKETPDQKVTACLLVAHELASLQRDILALQAGMDILTIEEPWKASEVLSGAKPILIVEGMSVGFLPKELFDKIICFYTDEETELKRRLARDTTVRKGDASIILASQQMRREQYLQYYEETESRADILVDQSDDKFQIKNKHYIEEKTDNLALKYENLLKWNKKTVSSKKFKKTCQIPCNRRGFVLFYYGAVNYSFSFDARGCDTLGCIATQHASVFLWS